MFVAMGGIKTLAIDMLDKSIGKPSSLQVPEQ